MVHRLFTSCLVLSLGCGASPAFAQERVFRLPDDDPNENSDVISSAAYSPDGSLVAAGYGRFIGLLQEPRPGQAVLWDVATAKRKATVTGHEDGISSVRFSPDGRLLATAGYAGAIRVWNIQKQREHLLLKAPGVIGTIAFSPDGSLLASGLWSGANGPGNDIIVWDINTGKAVRTLAGHADAVREVAFSADGKLLASGGMDGAVRLWSVATGKVEATLTFAGLRERIAAQLNIDPKSPESELAVESLAFSADGRTLVAAAGIPEAPNKQHGLGDVRFWTIPTMEMKAVLNGYDCFVKQVTYSPNGRAVATAGRDGVLRFWNAASLEEFGTLNATAPMAFSPDGRFIVANVGRRGLGVLRVPEK